MTGVVLRRLLLLLPTLWVVGTVAFLLTHALPGDPAGVMLGPEATPAQVQALRAELALDTPLGQRYLGWLADLARGDLGTSIHHDRPVTALLAERAVPTIQLALAALLVAVAVGLPAGVVASRRPGSALDRTVTLLATSATAVAGFFLAMLLVLLFAVTLGWLPATGSVPLGEDPVAHLRHLVLPALALGLPLAGIPARVLRAALLDLADADHLAAAAARGVGPRRQLLHHELPGAMVPTVTVLGTAVADLLGGAIIVETVFNLPGMGQLVGAAIAHRDLPVLTGAIVVLAGVHVLVSLVVDLVVAALDPRVDRVRL